MIILYAEDDQDDLENFQHIITLINPKIKVFHSQNGAEALEMLENASILPDYIFLDINMPVMTGEECIKK